MVGLTKSFGAAHALRDVSFAVEPGTVLALCGENGAGKSTLMGILAGAIPHGTYSGSIRVGGREMSFSGPGDAEACGIAMLPQELLVYPQLSVSENVLAAGVPNRFGIVRRGELHETAWRLCQRVGLDVDVSAPISSFEVSERQLACIARALAREPKVLILDEPTAVLPRQDAERLFVVIRDLAASGTTILYVSHHLSEVARLADQVAVLRNGRLVTPPTKGLTVQDIIEAMAGEGIAEYLHRAETLDRSNGNAIEIRLDSVTRGDRTVLGPCHLQVARGEILGVAGLAGSGRDDLIGALIGAPGYKLKGEVLLNGVRLPSTSPTRARAVGLAAVPAERRSDGLMMLDTIRSNLFLGSEARFARVGLRSQSVERSTAVALIADFGVVPDDGDRIVATLSGGNQQKVLIGRALSAYAECIVLAEPTRGVDVRARSAIHELMRKSAAAGRALVIASSDIDELLSLTHRIAVMFEGQCVAVVDAAVTDTKELLRLVTSGAEMVEPEKVSGDAFLRPDLASPNQSDNRRTDS